MSQTSSILYELRRRGEAGLTPLEALDLLGCFRLAARISDARNYLEDGEVIVNVGARINGKEVARYVLRRTGQPVLGL